jgi:putative transposase
MPQSLAKVYLHAIFSTKNREPILHDDWRDELFRVMGGTVNNLGCQSLTVGGVADHAHLLFQLGRSITIADAIGKIKSTSSLWVNHNHGLSSPFHWQAGYGVFSVSQSHVGATAEYIQQQASHHARVSFQDEFRDFLRRYQIAWDERYVWD